LETKEMKTKPLTYLLSLTFLFLFSGSSVVFGEDGKLLPQHIFSPFTKAAIAEILDGLIAYRNEDYITAMAELLPLAENGNINAQYWIGRMYEDGKGTPKNYFKAAKLYKSAAQKGHPAAQFFLGVLYGSGKGVPQNFELSKKWLQKSADQGVSGAEELLGTMDYFLRE